MLKVARLEMDDLTLEKNRCGFCESFRLELANLTTSLPAIAVGRSDLLILNRNNDSEGKTLSR